MNFIINIFLFFIAGITSCLIARDPDTHLMFIYQSGESLIIYSGSSSTQ